MSTLDEEMRDLYPMPGTRLKQWVVDQRRERAWELATCPRLAVSDHLDNTGAQCRSRGDVPWCDLDDHDCCEICNSIAEQSITTVAVDEWLIEACNRPSPCVDRDVYSDEVAT